jgi:hypothetical protein
VHWVISAGIPTPVDMPNSQEHDEDKGRHEDERHLDCSSITVTILEPGRREDTTIKVSAWHRNHVDTHKMLPTVEACPTAVCQLCQRNQFDRLEETRTYAGSSWNPSTVLPEYLPYFSLNQRQQRFFQCQGCTDRKTGRPVILPRTDQGKFVNKYT